MGCKRSYGYGLPPFFSYCIAPLWGFLPGFGNPPLFIVIPTLGGISVELYVSHFSKPALHLNAFLGYEALRGKPFSKGFKGD